MNCEFCEHRRPLDAIDEMESNGIEWICDKRHTQCEDVVCLLRMIIWLLNKEE